MMNNIKTTTTTTQHKQTTNPFHGVFLLLPALPLSLRSVFLSLSTHRQTDRKDSRPGARGHAWPCFGWDGRTRDAGTWAYGVFLGVCLGKGAGRHLLLGVCACMRVLFFLLPVFSVSVLYLVGLGWLVGCWGRGIHIIFNDDDACLV
ncbi:hypothetical protein QBC39DRAFT_357466 [Podospora conica]|nr:hypothetical protein QBC39DRAFT_357466 [Schizothecium conicum]